MKKKLLFICGSINQTTQMHQIAQQLPEYRQVFTPYYGNRDFDFLKSIGALESTIGGHTLGARCLDYLRRHHLPCEPGGALGDFDLALHCSDLVWPRNLDGKKVVLVQEGMTDPPSVFYPLVKRLSFLPGWLAGTSAFGLSNRYSRFCVASEGYRELFVARGCDPSKMVVTGIPNFDDCEAFRKNVFPYKGYVLCCTSDVREVFWYEDRRAFIEQAVRIARQHRKRLIFKLHPNERVDRAVREIHEFAPGSLVFTSGRAEHMVANCDVLVCKYSSVAHVGLALGKEVHSFFPNEELRRLVPLQNGGTSARKIAEVVRALLGDAPTVRAEDRPRGAALELSA
jgi:hypothetical protein